MAESRQPNAEFLTSSFKGRGDYEEKLQAALFFHEKKLDEDEKVALQQFLSLPNKSSDLWYAGLFHFSQIFFLKAQAPLDLGVDDRYNEFRARFVDAEEINALFFKLLHAALHPEPERLDERPIVKKFSEKKWYNEAETTRLGLRLERLEGNREADDLIRRIFEKDDEKLDIADDGDQDMWYTMWATHVKNLDAPVMPSLALWAALRGGKKYPASDKYKENGNYAYLKSMVDGGSRRDKFSRLPSFGSAGTIFVETWPERDFYYTNETTEMPPLAKKLGVTEFDETYFFSLLFRLWQKDVKNNQLVRSSAHKKVISDMGIDPEKFYIRMMTVDEYIRLAKKMKLGQSNRFTIVEDSYTDRQGNKKHWHIGSRVEGGASGIILANDQRKIEPGALPRLVVASLPTK